MNWKYFEPKFEYEEKMNDLALPWAGHKYFAYDLIRNAKPEVLVELGTFKGTSFFSFCQAVKDEKLGTKLFAIDTWQGDEHGGFYGDDIYKNVESIKREYYYNLDVQLLRKTFDEALNEFEDNSIDVLHIDGLHTYEAVKHDFETWLPKVKENGIILFHDIVVTRDDFGVFKFWKELKEKYATFEFRHSYGLGVLCLDENNSILNLKDDLELHYSYSLEDIENGKIGLLIQSEHNNTLKLNQKEEVIQQKEQEIQQKDEMIRQKETIIQQKEQVVKQREQELYDIRSSLRWKISNYLYKFYKNKIKKFIPRFIFELKDLILLILRKAIFNIRKINFKQIKNKIIKQDPFITIGIASYNHSKYLEKCIESALCQTYKKFDIIVVDDNSSDPENRRILKKYENNSRISILYKDKNEGISASLNDQVLNAKGDWVAFMDCDDYLPENALSEMAKYIKSNPEKELVFSNRIEIDQSDKFLRKVWFGNRYREGKMFEELLKGMVSSHLKLISKKAFRKVGLFDPRFGGTHDYDIFLRVAFYMPLAFGFIDKYLYYHRIHENQNTTVESEKHKRNVETILKESRLRAILYGGQFEKKVSIIVLSFNRYKQLKNTIDNILKYSKNIKREIIVWDNGSDYPQLLEYLEKINGKNNIKVVFCEENLKAAEGRRKATKLSNGDYILYFDNDIEVEKGFLEEMILRIEESDDIASCCAKVVFPDGKIQFTGGFVNKYDDKFVSFSLDNNGKNENDLISMLKRDYDWLGSGATMTKRKFSNLVEFDSGFINAYEDNDYYMQIKNKGGRLVHVPTAKVVHHHINYEINHDQGTKNYVKTRHKKESFIESWAYFYKKWNLIVEDDFIYGLAKLDKNSKKNIEKYINEHI